MIASGIPSSRSFSGRKISRGLALRFVWIEHPQVNQSRSRFPVRRPMGVVDGHYAVVHGSPPDAVAAFPSAKAVVGAIGQIEVYGVASRITFKVVEDQARMFQHGLDPRL